MSRHPNFEGLYVYENEDGTFDIVDLEGEVVEAGFDTARKAERFIRTLEEDYYEAKESRLRAALDQDEYFDNLPGGKADYAYDPFRGS